jgi:hypothetical protein
MTDILISLFFVTITNLVHLLEGPLFAFNKFYFKTVVLDVQKIEKTVQRIFTHFS